MVKCVTLTNFSVIVDSLDISLDIAIVEKTIICSK